LAALGALTLACGDEPPRAASGVSTATPRVAQAEATATPLPPPPGTVRPTSTPSATPRGTAEPTEAEVALADLVGEDAAQIAGSIVILAERCSETREELAEVAGRTWRILTEQRNIRAPMTAILTRVIASLPIDGRTVACESLFASVVIELTR